LEREIKDLDKEIREARKVAALASSLAEKLEAQKMIKTLEITGKRNANGSMRLKTRSTVAVMN
jgi:uncharacterized protein YeeX (DUF496 family)